MTQENSALVPSNYDKLPREARKTADSTFDRIYKYYHNSKTRIELTKEEINIRERWEKAWFLLCRHRTQKQVVELMCRLFNIGKSIAYDDVRNAMMLFSNPQNDMKDAKRAIAESALLQGASKAWNTGALEIHLKYMKQYIELNNLGSESPEGDMADMLKKLQPHTIVIVSNTKDLQDEAERLRKTIDVDFTTEENEG